MRTSSVETPNCAYAASPMKKLSSPTNAPRSAPLPSKCIYVHLVCYATKCRGISDTRKTGKTTCTAANASGQPDERYEFLAERSDHVGHAGGELLGVVDMQEFIGP